MTASEDPGPPLSAETPGTAEPSDDLEHWLRDLRTEVAVDPPGWIDTHPDDARPALPQDEPETIAPEPKSVGRHRSPD